jgi:protein phosphatase
LAGTIRYAGKTDIGKKRSSNQDQFLVAELCRSLNQCESSLPIDAHSLLYGASQSHLLMVADGMGGHQAGNRASELAIQYFVGCILSSQQWMTVPDQANEGRFLETLRSFLAAAHQAILMESSSKESYRGMGTTLTVAYLAWPKMWIVHAGDTRCYLLRDAVLQQLTRDHTLANQMASQGLLVPDPSERSPWSNVLWNALGASEPQIVAEIYTVDLQIGDRILLCSDGLNKHLEDHQIQAILNKREAPDTTCEILIQRSNELGGSDNVTTIVADILPPNPQELVTYRAQRLSADSEILQEFIDYIAIPDRTTVDHLNQPELHSTA